jgi:hypothetical protein
MTGDKQAKANRRNALKSTGPKTPERKAVVRYNAKEIPVRLDGRISAPPRIVSPGRTS